MWDTDESLKLPDPERLASVILEVPEDAEISTVLRSLARGRDGRTTLEALLPYVRAAHARQQAREEAPCKLNPNEKEFDAYFGVRRGGGSAQHLFHDALLIAYGRMLEESLRGHSLRPIEFGQLCAAMEELLHRTAFPYAGIPGPPPVALPLQGEAAALLRWRRGHHVFFVLVEGLILAHGALRRALEAQEEAAALDSLRLATDLWWAAAASLPFAGDLPEGSYEAVIRPSMMPPRTQREFSGLHSIDHAVLIRQLRSLRDRMAALPASLRMQHQSYLWSLGVVYQSHAAVCEHFVGNKASLTGQRNGARPAPEVLRNTLQKRTLALAGA